MRSSRISERKYNDYRSALINLIQIFAEQLGSKQFAFSILRKNMIDKTREYISRIMFLLSKKFKQKVDVQFLNEQIKLLILKNKIHQQNIVGIVKDSSIGISPGEYESEENILKTEKLIGVYRAIELFCPLDVSFHKIQQTWNRVFMRSLILFIRNITQRSEIIDFRKTEISNISKVKSLSTLSSPFFKKKYSRTGIVFLGLILNGLRKNRVSIGLERIMTFSRKQSALLRCTIRIVENYRHINFLKLLFRLNYFKRGNINSSDTNLIRALLEPGRSSILSFNDQKDCRDADSKKPHEEENTRHEFVLPKISNKISEEINMSEIMYRVSKGNLSQTISVSKEFLLRDRSEERSGNKIDSQDIDQTQNAKKIVDRNNHREKYDNAQNNLGFEQQNHDSRNYNDKLKLKKIVSSINDFLERKRFYFKQDGFHVLKPTVISYEVIPIKDLSYTLDPIQKVSSVTPSDNNFKNSYLKSFNLNERRTIYESVIDNQCLSEYPIYESRYISKKSQINRLNNIVRPVVMEMKESQYRLNDFDTVYSKMEKTSNSSSSRCIQRSEIDKNHRGSAIDGIDQFTKARGPVRRKCRNTYSSFTRN